MCAPYGLCRTAVRNLFVCFSDQARIVHVSAARCFSTNCALGTFPCSETCPMVTFCSLTLIMMKSTVFWDITSCSHACLARLIIRPWRWRWHVSPKRRFTFNGLHGVRSQKIVPIALLAICFHADILIGSYDPEHGGDMFLRNVAWVSADYTASDPGG
jgi:hypothetical protein